MSRIGNELIIRPIHPAKLGNDNNAIRKLMFLSSPKRLHQSAGASKITIVVPTVTATKANCNCHTGAYRSARGCRKNTMVSVLYH